MSIEIPISGDNAPFLAAIRELTAAMRQMTQQMAQSFVPLRASMQQTVSATEKMKASTQGVVSKAVGLVHAMGNVGSSVSSVVGGAQSIGVAFRAIKTGALVKDVKDIWNAVRSIKLGPLINGFAAMVRNGNFKNIVIGAIAAGTAIASIVVAVRVVRTGLRAMEAAAASVFKGIASMARSAGSSLRNMLPAVGGGGMLGPMAGLLGAGSALMLITSQIRGAVEAATGFEDTRVRIEQFSGSVANAAKLMQGLADFEVATPFELPDINATAERLMGSGIRGDILGLVKDLGAVSRNGQQLTELGDALGKGFSKGKFQTEELNKFLERGINLMPEFTAVTGLSGDALTKAIEKGLRFEDVTKAIRNMSQEGGQFFGLLNRQSRTATGFWSTMMGAFNAMRREFAQPILDALKPVLVDATKMFDSMRGQARDLGVAVGAYLTQGLAMVQDGKFFKLFRLGFNYAVEFAMHKMMQGLRGAIAFLATSLPPIFAAAVDKLRDPGLWEGIGNVLTGIGKNIAAEIVGALPFSDEADTVGLRAEGSILKRTGKRQMAEAGGVDFGEELVKALLDGGRAAMSAMKSTSDIDLWGARAELEGELATYSDAVKALMASVAIPPPSAGATGSGNFGRFDAVGGGQNQGGFIQSSLARIGGGGFGILTNQPLVTEQRKSNGLLKSMDQKLGQMLGTGSKGATFQ